jgi:hypothetical protein
MEQIKASAPAKAIPIVFFMIPSPSIYGSRWKTLPRKISAASPTVSKVEIETPGTPLR